MASVTRINLARTLAIWQHLLSQCFGIKPDLPGLLITHPDTWFTFLSVQFDPSMCFPLHWLYWIVCSPELCHAASHPSFSLCLECPSNSGLCEGHLPAFKMQLMHQFFYKLFLILSLEITQLISFYPPPHPHNVLQVHCSLTAFIILFFSLVLYLAVPISKMYISKIKVK